MTLPRRSPADAATARRAGRRPGIHPSGGSDARHRCDHGLAVFRVMSAGAGLSLIDARGEICAEELDDATRRLAGGLRGLGVGEGDLVGMLCRDHRIFVQVRTATSLLGATICYLSPAWTERQLRAACRASCMRTLVADEEFLEVCARAAPASRLITGWCERDRAPDGSVDRLIAAHDPLAGEAHGDAMMFTSGTTGDPKPVTIRFRDNGTFASGGLFAAVTAALPFAAGATTLLAAPLFHGWGLLNLAIAEALGSRVVLPAQSGTQSDVLGLLRRHCPSAIVTTPVLLRGLLARIAAAPAAQRPARAGVELIVIAGSALPPALAEDARRAFGDVLHSVYATSEAGLLCVATAADLAEDPRCVGRPLPGVALRVCGLDDDVAMAPGLVGRLTVRGLVVADRGTSPTPFVDTGDLGFLDRNGCAHVRGRSDDVIVTGGENVHPAEIEDALAALPEIADAAVVGVADDRYSTVIHAYVVAASGHEVSTSRVRRQLAGVLAAHMLPSRVTVVPSLPRNAAGKVLRRELAGGS